MATQQKSDLVSWTEDEFYEFDRLTWGTSSPDQLTRIASRMDLAKFIAEHGKVKCDAMFEEIMRREHEEY